MLNNSPKYIRDRFYRLRSYVWYNLFPQDEFFKKLNSHYNKKEKQLFRNKVNDIVDEAALILLIFFLNKFFSEGTKIAIETVDIFSDLELDGFWVGGIQYTKRNANVMMGEMLAKKLSKCLSNNVKNLIEAKTHPYQIIDMYKDFIKNI